MPNGGRKLHQRPVKAADYGATCCGVVFKRRRLDQAISPISVRPNSTAELGSGTVCGVFEHETVLFVHTNPAIEKIFT